MPLREGRTQFSVSMWEDEKQKVRDLAMENRLTLSKQIEALILLGLKAHEVESTQKTV